MSQPRWYQQENCRPRRRFRWRGPQPAPCEEQIANAPDTTFDLSPVSTAAATQTTANWAATLPSDIPFIWERRYDGEEVLYD